MKNLTLIISAIFIIGLLKVDSQNLNNFDLRAHYELNSDGTDLIGNYDDIPLDTPIFSNEGILSRGCYALNTGFGDSCLIETPLIDALNDNAFAVQVDFNLSVFDKPIFIMGHSHRYLGLETLSDGTLSIRMNNYEEIAMDDLILELDQWYQATFIHTKGDSLTQLYLDGTFIYAIKEELNLDEDDTNISNSNFAVGRAFFGYLKNLKVYSSSIATTTEDHPEFATNFKIWPNPANDYLSVDVQNASDIHYKIVDVSGKEMIQSRLINNVIDVQRLNDGLYFLILYNAKNEAVTTKFIKQ